MNPSEEAEFLGHMLHAISVPYGVVLRSNDPNRLRNALYSIRAEALPETPALAGLAFRLNPLAPDSELWLIRTNPKGSKPSPAES
jgi:hypothetical protein